MTVESLLFTLLRSAVFDEPVSEKTKNACTPEMLADVYNMAKMHDVAHLVGKALDGLGLPDSEPLTKYRNKMLQAVYRYYRQDFEYKKQWLTEDAVKAMDLYENGDEIYVRIVDYKTGKHEFSFREVLDGTDIQLILYLFAVVSSKPDRFRFGGANFLYSYMEEGKTAIGRQGVLNQDEALRNAFGQGEEAKRYTKDMVMATSQELENLARGMLETVERIAERILAGEAHRTPSENACRFCLVREHCAVAYHGKND